MASEGTPAFVAGMGKSYDFGEGQWTVGNPLAALEMREATTVTLDFARSSNVGGAMSAIAPRVRSGVLLPFDAGPVPCPFALVTTSEPSARRRIAVGHHDVGM